MHHNQTPSSGGCALGRPPLHRTVEREDAQRLKIKSLRSALSATAASKMIPHYPAEGNHQI